MKEKLTKIVSLLHLKLSDLFFAIGFIPMAVFLINGQLFMQYPNPEDVSLKLEAIIPLFVILVICWGIYIFLENRIGNKENRYITATFVLLTIIGIIGILIQPSIFIIEFTKSDGDISTVGLTISPTHYVFFIFDIISIILLIYIGVFILPKRFTNIKVIQFVGYILFLFSFVLIIYSLITEFENYKGFISTIISKEYFALNWYSVKSFIIHKNAFGMVLLIAIIFCYINHSISKKWFYFPLSFLFFIFMIFTYCKTSIIIAPIISIIYFYFSLIQNYKNHQRRRNLILLILLSLFLAVGVSIFAISFITDGFAKQLYESLFVLNDGTTLNARESIWSNTYQLVAQTLPTSLFFGRGFGLVNEMLLPMNIANGDNQLSFPTHNGFLNLFAEGGLPYLFAYLILLGYVTYIAFKSFEKNPSTTLAIALGLFSFVFYSLIETIHYLTYVFMLVLLAFYHSQEMQQKN